MEAKEGDRVKVIGGSHSYRGREGAVDQCEAIDGQTFVHASLESGEKIILRPGQYKVTKRVDQAPEDRLSPEILSQIRRVADNAHYTIPVRRRVLENIKAEIETMLTLLDYEEQGEKEALDHEQEPMELPK